MNATTKACDWCCHEIPMTPGRKYWFIEQDWEDEDHKEWVFRWYYHVQCWKNKLKVLEKKV